MLTRKRVVTLPKGVGAVLGTCQWPGGVTLPAGVGLSAPILLSVPILESKTSIPQRRAVKRAPLSRSRKALGLQQQNI